MVQKTSEWLDRGFSACNSLTFEKMIVNKPMTKNRDFLQGDPLG